MSIREPIQNRAEIFMPSNFLAAEFSEEPYWTDGLPRFEIRSATPPRRVDVAVIGGGYAGLSTALSLARAGRSVVVFEARKIGDGAAARAAGSLSHVPKATLSELTSRYGQPTAFQIYREAREAREYVEHLIQELQIVCGLRSGWRFVAAHSARAFERLNASLPILKETWGAVEIVPRERQREVIGSDAFFGGVKIPDSATLQPALLQRGLAKAAVDAGASLLQNARVTDVEGEAGQFSITSEAGTFIATHVVLATNAETTINTKVIKRLGRRLIPVPAFAIATNTVSKNVMQKVLPIGGPVSDTYKIINYIAPDETGARFIMSGRAGRSDGGLRVKAERMFSYFRDRFPDLAEVQITHCWTGRFAATADWVPHVGIEGGLHYVLGCCGTGIPMATYLGHKVAQMIVGNSRSQTVFDRPLPQLPLFGAEGPLLPLAVSGYELRDRLFR